jgi:D-alanyl-D-alanine carboxypeptidase
MAQCALVIIAIFTINTRTHKEIATTCTALESQLYKSTLGDVFNGVVAQAVYAENISHGEEILAKNADTRLPLASLVKLMTARIVLNFGTQSDTTYTLTEKDTAVFGTIPGIVPGATFTTKDLILASLVSSSNDAAEALMNSTSLENDIFFDAMNKEAASLGLNSLQFSSATGLDIAQQATGYGNARDISRLYAKNITDYPNYFVFPQNVLKIVSRDGSIVTLNPTNTAIPQLELLVASKTGYTLTAGGNLAVIWQHPIRPNEYISAVALGSTISGRFSDIVRMYNHINRYFVYQQTLTTICT